MRNLEEIELFFPGEKIRRKILKISVLTSKVNIRRAVSRQLNAKYREDGTSTMGSRLPNPTESGHM